MDLKEKSGLIWHNIRENPNDLPGHEGLFVIYWKLGTLADYMVYRGEIKTPHEDVVAWCELPLFEGVKKEMNLGDKINEFVDSKSSHIKSFTPEAVKVLLKDFINEVECQKTVWHDLTVNPNDLPASDRNILVCREFDDDTEIDNYYNDDEFVGWGTKYRDPDAADVIAWAEMPKFRR